MLAKNTVLLLIALIALSQCEIIVTNPEAKPSTPTVSPATVSTYAFKNKYELDKLKNNADFKTLVAKTKKFWENNMSEILGEVAAVEEQVVNGINRRITFEVKTGHIIKKVIITINLQPSIPTMKVKATAPIIPGGIVEGDLTKIIVPVEQSKDKQEAVKPAIKATVTRSIKSEIVKVPEPKVPTVATKVTTSTSTKPVTVSEPVQSFFSVSQTAVISKPPLLGSYTLKSNAQVARLQKENEEFSEMITLTKNFWRINKNENLGDLISVEEQIVAGSNYRLIFETVGNASSKEVVIIVFVQPWSNIMRVTYTSPQIQGGIKNGDLAKSVAQV